MMRSFSRDALAVEVHATRQEMGHAAAGEAARTMQASLGRQGPASILLSAAASEVVSWPAAGRKDESIGGR